MAGSRNKNRQRKCPMRLLCLSDLPDEILIHILSFLPTKPLVSTSLLSRRWRYLWTATPNLRLDESEFKDDRNKLMNFADRAFILRTRSSLVSFSLSCRVENDDESRINTWITSAIQHNVEQLSLNIKEFEESFVLPLCIFRSQSLVKLDLQMNLNCSIRVPSMICLPRLKHLALKWLEFADNESAEKLLSHPLLEELIICECTWYRITTVNVNSPKLQSLAIEDKYHSVWSEVRQVCFLGDNLNFFRYEGYYPPTQFCICGSTMQLREAVILVRGRNFWSVALQSNRYCKLLNSLSGVHNLTLSEGTAKSLYLLSQSMWLRTTLPVFDRLTRLNLKGCYRQVAIRIDSVWLTMLYERCPHLEHLNFMEMVKLDSTAPVLRPMPSCFRTHLKKVTLQSYEPKSNERDDQAAINLLFNSTPVLEEVVIYWKKDGCISGQVSRVKEMERELNACPKVSQNCRVSIVLV